MQLWWNDTGRGGEAEVLGAKHVALSLCPPQILHEVPGIEPGPPPLQAAD